MNTMPDFDTKTIPILDDIIKSENTNTTTINEQEITSAEILKTDTSTITDNNFEVDDTADFNKPDDLTLNDDETIHNQQNHDNHNFDDPVKLDKNASATEVSNHSLSLEAIVEDVVKHLMPDLEQQLRFLVQQALEEKLPKKVIRHLSTRASTFHKNT